MSLCNNIHFFCNHYVLFSLEYELSHKFKFSILCALRECVPNFLSCNKGFDFVFRYYVYILVYAKGSHQDFLLDYVFSLKVIFYFMTMKKYNVSA